MIPDVGAVSSGRLPRWSQRLTVRLTGGVIVVLLSIGVPFLFAFHRLLRAQQFETLESTTSSLSSLVVNGLRTSMTSGQPHLLDGTVRKLADQPEGERVILMNHEGRVSVSSDREYDGRTLDRGSDDTCVVCHHDRVTPPTSRMTVAEHQGKRVFRTVTIIRNEEECHRCHSAGVPINGLLLMDLNLRSFDRRYFAGIGSIVALGAVMVLLTIAVLAWLLRKMVLSPLEAVVASSQRIVDGDFESRSAVSGAVEFAHLAWQVNRMTDHLAASIREAESRRRELQTILDAIDDEVVVLDAARRVVTANVAFRAKTQQSTTASLAGFCGDHRDTQWPCGIDQPNNCPVAKAFATGTLEKGIVSYVDASGENRVLEIHASPVAVEEEVVRQVVEVRRDITGRRQMEAILAHSEHLASLGLLASGLSHEINNPLGAIATLVEGLRRRLGDDPDFRGELRARFEQSLSRIAGEVERCRTTTNRLLRIARPSDRARNLVDVNHLIQEVLALLNHDVVRAGITVELELQQGLPIVRGDEAQIVQIIMNVCMNAVQAMADRGGRLRVATHAEDQRIVLTIEDSGQGIAPEVYARIFEPFFTTKPAGKGTGLGLFITNQIVTSLGGTIHVQSEPGVGATVVVQLPLDDRRT